MDPAATLFSPQNGLTMILLAGVMIYLGSRAGRDAVIGGGPATGARVALGHWIPVGVMAIWAAATDGLVVRTGHGDFPTYHGTVAMGILFGTAVGGLLLAGGAAVLVSPPGRQSSDGQSPHGQAPDGQSPGRSRLLMSMLVPVGLVTWMIGFSGSVTVWGALALLAEGLVILAAVLRRPTDPVPVIPIAGNDAPPWRTSPAIRGVQFGLACCLAVVAAWVGLHGVDRLVGDNARATPGLLTSILLCPLLVLPMVGTATELAQRGRSAEVVEAGVWLAVGNLCFVIPMVLAASRIGFFVRNLNYCLNAYKAGNPIPFKTVSFPVAVWRIDLLFILAAGLLLLPVATGRWTLSKRDGLGMTLAYGIYLFLPIYMIRLSRG